MKNKGFTLVEFLLVFAIIGIMSVVVLGNRSSVNNRLVLKNAADDVAFAFRQAQIEGLAVRENPNTPGDFDVGYGVYVDADEESKLVLFVDQDNGGPRNKIYDGNFDCAASEECVSILELDRVIIDGVCGGDGNNCTPVSGNKKVSALFARPRPEVLITRHGGGGQTFDTLGITLETLSGESATVFIRRASEISIEYN